VEVRSDGITVTTPTPTPVLPPPPTPTSLPPEEGANNQGWRARGVSGFGGELFVFFPESWIDGPAASLHFQERSVDPYVSDGPYLELRGLSPEISPPTSLDELVAWAVDGLEKGGDPFGLLTYHEIFGRA